MAENVRFINKDTKYETLENIYKNKPRITKKYVPQFREQRSYVKYLYLKNSNFSSNSTGPCRNNVRLTNKNTKYETLENTYKKKNRFTKNTYLNFASSALM